MHDPSIPAPIIAFRTQCTQSKAKKTGLDFVTTTLCRGESESSPLRDFLSSDWLSLWLRPNGLIILGRFKVHERRKERFWQQAAAEMRRRVMHLLLAAKARWKITHMCNEFVKKYRKRGGTKCRKNHFRRSDSHLHRVVVTLWLCVHWVQNAISGAGVEGSCPNVYACVDVICDEVSIKCISCSARLFSRRVSSQNSCESVRS